MVYYPLIKVPKFSAKTTVFNFSPNNWELRKPVSPKFINASWVQDGLWHTTSILFISPNQCIDVTSDQCEILAGIDRHVFLSMSNVQQSYVGNSLPEFLVERTSYPEWRASLHILSEYSSTSYLGEIAPFPSKSSCLSFGGMFQQELHIKNNVIFINLEKSSISRTEVLTIHSPHTGKIIEEFVVKNNSVNLLEMPIFEFEKDFLPVIISRGMGGIPLYFSHDSEGVSLSLEHSHPPSSYVVHGDRNRAQRELKKYWFERCK
jgi:hypothetical protein